MDDWTSNREDCWLAARPSRLLHLRNGRLPRLRYHITMSSGALSADNSYQGIFAPGQANVGSDPAVFGLLAVLIVELFQSWQIVPNPWTEFAKLAFVILLALMVLVVIALSPIV